MFRQILVLFLFFSFCFSTFEHFFEIFQEETVGVVDDFCDDTSDEDEKKVANDKICTHFHLPIVALVLMNTNIYNDSHYNTGLLSAAISIPTPPPKA
jgi:hypothetical protein